MKALPLFDRLASIDVDVPARRDNLPQLEAAALVAPRARTQAWRILRALQMLGPSTRDEICALTGISTGAACARLWAMEYPDRSRPAMLAGPALVCRIGRRRARSGVRVSVYDLTPEGRRL